MAKAFALIASALCVLALAGLAQCHQGVFNVEGKVYCDTCRVLFPTRISEYLADAVVELKCRSRVNGTVTVTVSGKTDNDGHYSLAVSGNHEDEICEVTAVSSPNPECGEAAAEISSSRISLDENSGILSASRFCNPIGFQKKIAVASCIDVLDELGFVPLV